MSDLVQENIDVSDRVQSMRKEVRLPARKLLIGFSLVLHIQGQLRTLSFDIIRRRVDKEVSRLFGTSLISLMREDGTDPRYQSLHSKHQSLVQRLQFIV